MQSFCTLHGRNFRNFRTFKPHLSSLPLAGEACGTLNLQTEIDGRTHIKYSAFHLGVPQTIVPGAWLVRQQSTFNVLYICTKGVQIIFAKSQRRRLIRRLALYTSAVSKGRPQ